MKAVTAATMRELDKTAIETVLIPGMVLMENAGAGAFRVLDNSLRAEGNGGSGLVLVLCGGGNNGGDGYVIARHLANHGYEVRILATREGERLAGDAHANWRIADAMDIPMTVVTAESDLAGIVGECTSPMAVVDALLGTGASKEIRGVYRGLVEAANGLDCFRLAVDIPTGVHADTGEVLGAAFRADATATFGLPKVGLYLYPGAEYCGAIHTVDISIPAPLLAAAEGTILLGTEGTLPPLPLRPVDSHKNRLGHLLVVAGSPGKGGAALMAGLAGLRSGVGLCTLATDEKCRASLEGKVPDLMVLGLDMETPPCGTNEGLLADKSGLAMGPGMGTGDEAFAWVRWLLNQTSLPVVADADALTLFAGRAEQMRRTAGPLVITPHPGEMARLTGLSTARVQADRLGVSRRLSGSLDAVVVLKGAHTVVAAPDGRQAINLSGTAAMAKAGSGDVLTGIIGAYLAMGMDAFDAACLGTFVHGRCGELVEETRGVHGVVASDLAQAVPEAVLRLMGT
jgi:ADP-dependent NAD(P)H-hydrate dehydratase / NAD(P)H-hydrate epimerase